MIYIYICIYIYIYIYIKAIIPKSIGAYDLVANASKWERTKITQDTDDQWKKVTKLGSLHGDEKDMQRRMDLAIDGSYLVIVCVYL